MENGSNGHDEYTMPTIKAEPRQHDDQEKDPEEPMIIPGGHRARRLIHHVPQGTTVDQKDGLVRHLDSNQNMIKEIAHLDVKPKDTPLMPGQVVRARAVTKQQVAADPSLAEPVTFGTGWVTYTGWTNTTGTPISFFSTTWKVPPAPISQTSAPNDRHVIFLFSGIQNSAFIYQPVLQWGDNGYPNTGPFWCVASWYVDSQNGLALHTDFVRVNPGDIITGVMTRTGGTGDKHSYNCFFTGIPNTTLTMTNIEELTWANETLEVYGTTGATSYPPTFRTRMYNINIRTGNVNPPLSWQINNAIRDCGQHSVVVRDGSVNGEVNLCFGTVALPSTALVSWADQRLDVLGLGLNSDLAHKYWANWAQGWGVRDWEMLGGFLNSGPVAVCSTQNWINIFGLGKDNGCWHKWWDGSKWNGWESLGGIFTSPLAVSSWGPGRLDLFGLGQDYAVWHKAYERSWWPPSKGWERLGGKFNSPPVAVCWSTNRIDIFGLGTDNAMYHKYWNGSWGPSNTDWEYLGGIFNSPPTVISWGPNRLDIFCLGVDNSCYHKAWNGSSWYPSATGWENLGGKFTSCVQAESQRPNSIDLVGLGLDYCCWHNRWNGSTWQGWVKISSSTLNSTPSTVSWSDNRLDIVAFGSNNQMLAKSWTSAGWSPAGLDWVDLGGIFQPD